MSSSMKAVIHLGPNDLENSEIHTNTQFEEIESLFSITQKLVMEHSEEILNVKCLEYSSPSWARSVLSHDQAIKWAQKYVSMLIPFYVLDRWRKVQERWTDGKVKWKDSGFIRLIKMQWESMEKQLNSIGKISQDFHVYSSRDPRKTWRDRTSSPKSSRTGSSLCQCSMTLIGKIMMRIVFRMPKRSRITPWNSRKEIGRFLVQDRKKSGMEVLGQWNCTANKMVQRFKETGHLVFKSISAPSRGILKQKKGKSTIHFNADASNTELLC